MDAIEKVTLIPTSRNKGKLYKSVFIKEDDQLETERRGLIRANDARSSIIKMSTRKSFVQ
mgnify:CR=1 FL=1